MARYGIMSIAPDLSALSPEHFSQLYVAAGQNTGNLLFTNAVWRHLTGDHIQLGFAFDPDRVNEVCDAVVVPAANWVSPNVDFGHLANLIESLKIPVIVIGLGAQAPLKKSSIDIPEGTRRFLSAVADRSSSISVRGPFSQKILSNLGFDRTVVTGCPSLYTQFAAMATPDAASGPFDLKTTLLHATRFSAENPRYAKNDTINRAIFRFAYERRVDLLFQSEPEEMALLLGFESMATFNDRLIDNLKAIYAAEEWHQWRDYILAHGRTFLNVNAWAQAMQDYNFVLGTRLHGTIMALNSGRPAALLWHDSRTREIAEFAAIPAAPAHRFTLTEAAIETLHAEIDMRAYHEKRETNRRVYQSFLEDNGLAHALNGD